MLSSSNTGYHVVIYPPTGPALLCWVWSNNFSLIKQPMTFQVSSLTRHMQLRNNWFWSIKALLPAWKDMEWCTWKHKNKFKCRSTDKELVDEGCNAGHFCSVYYMTHIKSERDTFCGTISINPVLFIVEYWLLRFQNIIITWSTFGSVFLKLELWAILV